MDIMVLLTRDLCISTLTTLWNEKFGKKALRLKQTSSPDEELHEQQQLQQASYQLSKFPIVPLSKMLGHLPLNHLISQASWVCPLWCDEQQRLCRIRTRITLLVGGSAAPSVLRNMLSKRPDQPHNTLHLCRMTPTTTAKLIETFPRIVHLEMVFEYAPSEQTFQQIIALLSSPCYRPQLKVLKLLFNRPARQETDAVKRAIATMMAKVNQLSSLRYLYIKYLGDLFPADSTRITAYLPVLRHLNYFELDSRDMLVTLACSLIVYGENNLSLQRIALSNWLHSEDILRFLVRLAPRLTRKIVHLKMLPMADWPLVRRLFTPNFCSLITLTIEVTGMHFSLPHLAECLSGCKHLRLFTLLMDSNLYVKLNENDALEESSLTVLPSVVTLYLAINANHSKDHGDFEAECLRIPLKFIFPNVSTLIFHCKACPYCGYQVPHYFDNRAPPQIIPRIEHCCAHLMAPLERTFDRANVGLKAMVPLVGRLVKRHQINSKPPQTLA